MAEREHLGDIEEADVERSTAVIRQDIAKEKENISQTVEQIGEHIKNELDWREYVKESPYLAMGIAAGLGYVASGMFRKRPTPVAQILDSLAKEVHGSLGALHGRAAGPGLIKGALFGIATQAAAGWIKDVTSASAAKNDAGPRQQTEQDQTVSQRVDI
jgi:ElaB/YqjD/DUF883 family membrane-anchored ribosome-binding protein